MTHSFVPCLFLLATVSVAQAPTPEQPPQAKFVLEAGEHMLTEVVASASRFLKRNYRPTKASKSRQPCDDQLADSPADTKYRPGVVPNTAVNAATIALGVV